MFTILGFTSTALLGQMGTFAMAAIGIAASGGLWKQTMKADTVG